MLINKNIRLTLISLIILLNGCGFKVLDKSNANNFFVKEIITSGDKRINYKIKNNLFIYSKQKRQNEIILYVDTKKNKNIKEKNIKNEITKYAINLEVNVSFDLVSRKSERQNMTFNIIGDYTVDKFHTKTLANEKKLIDSLVENISEKIAFSIGTKINDI